MANRPHILPIYGVVLDWIEDGRLEGFEAPAQPHMDSCGLRGSAACTTPPLDTKGQLVGTI